MNPSAKRTRDSSEDDELDIGDLPGKLDVGNLPPGKADEVLKDFYENWKSLRTLNDSDIRELVRVLHFAVQKHSEVYKPTPMMVNAFARTVFTGWFPRIFSDTDMRNHLLSAGSIENGDYSVSLPKTRFHAYSKQPENVPNDRPIVYLLKVSLSTAEVQYRAMYKDDDGNAQFFIDPDMGNGRRSRLESAIITKLATAFEKFNSDRAVLLVREWLHRMSWEDDLGGYLDDSVTRDFQFISLDEVWKKLPSLSHVPKPAPKFFGVEGSPY